MSVQLLIAQLMLMGTGLLAVVTARPDLAVDHGGKVVLGLLTTLLVARIRPARLVRAGPALWIGAIILLVLVLIIGVGTAESEATRRWIEFGPVRFQPSEMAKLALVIMLASFFSRRGVENKLLSATIMIMVTTGLILVEPDLGTTVLTFTLGLTVMYAAGVKISNLGWFGLALMTVAVPFAGIYVEKHPYILARLNSHQNREGEMAQGLDQVGMAHRDLLNGGMWGQGPDAPRYQYFAAHTDMIIATVGFQGGMVAIGMIFIGYWLIVATALEVGTKVARIRPMTPGLHAAGILATGSMFMVIGQAMINLSVASGIAPVTGVTLPLVSYGFSSMLTMSAALGIIHSCLREVRLAESRQALHTHTGADEKEPQQAQPEPTESGTPLPA